MTQTRTKDVVARIRNDSKASQTVLDNTGSVIDFYSGQIKSVFVTSSYVDHLRDRSGKNFLTVLSVREVADDPVP